MLMFLKNKTINNPKHKSTVMFIISILLRPNIGTIFFQEKLIYVKMKSKFCLCNDTMRKTCIRTSDLPSQ